MMKVLSFNLMVCGAILSAHSVKNCSPGKSQPLKAFGDFEPLRMIFPSLFSLAGVEIQHSFPGLGGKGGGTKAIGSGSPGSLPWGKHHF